MTKQIMIGLMTEGTTDERFLGSVVKRTFEQIALDCWGDIEILDIVVLNDAKDRFVNQVLTASRRGLEQHGITVLCVHTDADSNTDTTAYENKINPAREALHTSTDVVCANLVAIVPIYMQEAWLLADTTLLKTQIGTQSNDAELGLDRHPEKIADPKQLIKTAIRLARQEETKRRRQDLKIGELYQPLGQMIPLTSLQQLSSYQKFEQEARDAMRALKLLL